ncbi:MAG: UDP-N-acetylmuramoyl-L-alanyl-D-glutamate--2,6-diaminopimelate ligase [Patescibacteria group bacterium]|nr:UDP-N-acetylmuramoyl-L-alanyl-D-glutamate--2,6-diaminopimelate ligase [Patescibacteria group bacterium]MDD5534776.1 UDP-N-acetylmuramoyl-L-alanyl-D-glutamate--2,6-diaminopimelate ligase [Patescibacteria group bacterium]
MLKSILKKIIPKKLFIFYYQSLALLAAFFYNQPSQKMIVIGITGTAGKSTVVNLVGRILEKAGYQCGWATTFNFKVGPKEWINKTKMTMLGRFALQKMLKQMLAAGSKYAIIETSSEGIIQSRHLGINYDVAVFTNLSPEHIESHGGFDKYRQAKQKLFYNLTKKHKRINGRTIKKVIVANLDDENAEHFLKFPADEKYGYTIKNLESRIKNLEGLKVVKAENICLDSNNSKFQILNSKFIINLAGEFNVYNSLAAICVALSQGVSLEICQKALEEIELMPGRMEKIITHPFEVIVDYAHTPESLEQVYKTLQNSKFQIPNSKLICVLGAAGGGRDKWKRPKLGELAEKYCDHIIITNEDPYNENPEKIIDEIISGIKNKNQDKILKIIDRREAIRKALSLAKEKDVVVITGKGCEQCIMGQNNTRFFWDDREVAKEEFNKI